MKRKNNLILIIILFTLQYSYSQNSWTFYSNTSFKGSYKEYTKGLSGTDLGSGRLKNSRTPGVMKVSSQWKWNSWRTNHCVRMYYYTKYGKIAEKNLCGNVVDFKSELKKWKGLKYGYSQGWKNIHKIVLYYNTEKHVDKGYDLNPNDAYNQRNNKNFGNRNNSNYVVTQDLQDYKTRDWYSYYGKGNVIFTEGYNYKGEYKARATGSQDYRSLRFYPRSIIVSRSGRYVVVEYKDKYNKRKSFVVKKDIPDLKKYMASNLKLGSKYYQEPYKAITKLTVMRN